MKTMRKLLLLLAALMLALVFCGAAFAEGGADPSETTAPEDTAVPSDAEIDSSSDNEIYNVTCTVTDGEGMPVKGIGVINCVNSGAPFFIKHDYIITFGYNANGTFKETDDKLLIEVDTSSGFVIVNHNQIKLKAADKPYSFNVKYQVKSSGGEGDYTFNVQRFKLDFADMLTAAVGVYIIVSALRAKGSLFNDEYIKDDKKVLFKRLMRILAIGAGVIFIISAVLSVCFSYLDWVRTVRLVIFIIGLALLIGMIVLSTVFTDKEKRAKAQRGPVTAASSSNAAFEFDEDEPTLDEVLAKIEREQTENEKTEE